MMENIKISICIMLSMLLASYGAYSQSSVAVAYYDIGSTAPGDVVSVVDSMAMPLVILRGVESEDEVREMVAMSCRDYSYLYRALDYYDNPDFAMLYYGDIFFVEQVYNHQGYLYVAAEYDGYSIDLHLTLRGNRLYSVTPQRADREVDMTLACGELTADDLRRVHLRDPLLDHERLGRGDRRNDRGWYLDNRVGVDTTTTILRSGLYITEAMAKKESTHLPIYLFLEGK